MTSTVELPSVRQALRADVSARIVRLQEGYLDRRGPAVQASAQADLARLRAADPADPVRHPDVWQVTSDNTSNVISPQDGPDEPTSAESARHCAMVLYALHQQGKDQPMHQAKVGFAQAARVLGSKRAAAGEEFDPSVRGRFDQVILASTLAVRAEHLKSLVRMMRSEDVGFDYCRLAVDLYDMSTPDGARRVRLAWSRDLYRRADSEVASSNDPTDTPNTHHQSEGDLS